MSSTKVLRVAFAGTPAVAAFCLEKILQSPHSLVQVYTQPDRPSGRGLKMQGSPVKQVAIERALPIMQPTTLTDPEVGSALKALKVDILVVVAYGLLLPKSFLTIPRLGCINIHFSLLPRWRGAAPVERAILAGDSETGVTVMQMEEGLDTGAILLQRSCAIMGSDSANTVYERLVSLGGEVLLQALMQLAEGPIDGRRQDGTQATYAKKIKKEEALIQWKESALTIHRLVCAFNPQPVAFTFIGDIRLRIWETQVLSHDKTDYSPGTLIEVSSQGLSVATGQGILKIMQCQLPGGKVQPIHKLLHGFSQLFSVGTQFSNHP